MKKVIGGKAPFRTALLMVAMFAGTVAPLAVRADEGGDGYGYGGDGGSGSQEYYGEGRYDDEHVPSQRALRPDRNKTPKTTADGARYFRDAADVPDSVQLIGSRPGPARYVRAVVPTPVVERTPPVLQQPIAEVFEVAVAVPCGIVLMGSGEGQYLADTCPQGGVRDGPEGGDDGGDAG